MAFTNVTSRARAFGVISGLGGIGAAAGPLIGGLIATAISWRAAFVFQALIVATIVLLSRRLRDPVPPDPTRPFDVVGAVLSAVGMFFLVFGIQQAGTHNVLLAVFLAIGVIFLVWFFLYIRAREREGKEALLSTGLFKNRVSNLGLVTQNAQCSSSWGPRSSSPCTSRPFAGTTRSRPGSSSRRRPSASSC